MANVENQTYYEGTPEADSISGTSGADTLSGASGNDTILGLTGNDLLAGGFGDDSIQGGGGNDFIGGNQGADTLDGGAGIDLVNYDDSPTGVNVVMPGANPGTAHDGTGSIDTLYNFEKLWGSNFADTLTGSIVDRQTYQAFDGNDTINGMGGTDIIEFSSAPAGVYVHLTSGLSKDLLDHQNNTQIDVAQVGVDTFTNIEQIQGSRFADHITAAGFGFTADAQNKSSSRNTYALIQAGKGNDIIEGNGNTEISFNDVEHDSGVVVDLTAGTAQGNWSGSDKLLSGIISVTGTNFADSVKGSVSIGDTFTGLGGNDTFEGGGDYDASAYGASTSKITVNLATGKVVGGSDVGEDTLIGIEAIVGTTSADEYDASNFGFTGNNAPDSRTGIYNSFHGLGGNDSIIGNGATRIQYNSAKAGVYVSLVAGYAKDLLDQDQGTSLDKAQVGVDRFSGVYYIRGSEYNDRIVGGNAATDRVEVFEGRGGEDTFEGGSGFDRAVFNNSGILTYFTLVNGTARFAVDENGDQIYKQGLSIKMAEGKVTGDATIIGSDSLSSIESIYGTWLDDQYDATGFGGSSINSGSFGAVNEFEGFLGNDTIIGNGQTRLTYAAANAGVYVNLATNESIDLADKQKGTRVDAAQIGLDFINGGVNSIRGTYFDDHLIGGKSENDLLEVLDGRAGNDTLDGGSGFDRARYDNHGSMAAWIYDGSTLRMMNDGLSESPYTFKQGINVQLASGVVTGDANWTGSDVLLSIEAVTGSVFSDIYDATGFNGISKNAGSLGAFNEFEGFDGNDTVIGNGYTRVSYANAESGVLVDLEYGSSESLIAGNKALVGLDSLTGINAVRGSRFDDEMIGIGNSEKFDGLDGDDSFLGAGGDDRINGGNGEDTAIYLGGISQVISLAKTPDDMGVVIKTANEGTDILFNVEYLQFGSTPAMSLVEAFDRVRPLPAFSAVFSDADSPNSDGDESGEEIKQSDNTALIIPEVYTGPVANIEYQLIDSTPNAVIVAASTNDFIALQGTGNKAVNGGGGINVIDGGVGSTFITGGSAGYADTFFLDGRAPGSAWSTITDFELGLDNVTIWGWKAGVSRVSAGFADFNSGGAEGYKGLTLHFENLLPDNASETDTNPNFNSITLSGKTLEEFGASSLDELNAQIHSQVNGHFQVNSVTDAFGEHGYLYIS